MKKFLATLLLSAVCAASVFAFTACDGNEEQPEQPGQSEPQPEQPEVIKTVTEQEWKTALGYFMVDFDADNKTATGNYSRVNFNCVMDLGIEGLTNLVYSVDYDKKISFFTMFDEPESWDLYAWEDGGVFYSAEDLEKEYEKKILESEEQLYNEFEACVAISGGGEIFMMELPDKYELFAYSEENDAYTASLEYIDGDGENCSSDVTLKFENGMLCYMEVTTYTVDLGEELIYTVSYTYTYGTTVTVPEFYQNLAVGIIPKE